MRTSTSPGLFTQVSEAQRHSLRVLDMTASSSNPRPGHLGNLLYSAHGVQGLVESQVENVDDCLLRDQQVGGTTFVASGILRPSSRYFLVVCIAVNLWLQRWSSTPDQCDKIVRWTNGSAIGTITAFSTIAIAKRVLQSPLPAVPYSSCPAAGVFATGIFEFSESYRLCSLRQ
jgi:hypothetical protein